MRRRSTKSHGSIEVRHTTPLLAPGLQYQAFSGELVKRARTQQRRMSLGTNPWHARWFVLRDDMLHYFMSEAVTNGPSRDVLCLQDLKVVGDLDDAELRRVQAREAGDLVFKLEGGDGAPLYLQASDASTKERWVSALAHNIYLVQNPRGGLLAANGFRGAGAWPHGSSRMALARAWRPTPRTSRDPIALRSDSRPTR
jgi:hypothetical protein